MAYKGKFKPNNPSKYKGDPSNIVYRSLWEFHMMRTLDAHPDVIQWSSEEFFIMYMSPIDGKKHRYFPDFYVKKKNKDGNIEEVVIEIKPKAQTMPPKVIQKPTRRYLNEVKTWGVNSAKWKAADAVCKKKGWKFIIMHEDHLGVNDAFKGLKKK